MPKTGKESEKKTERYLSERMKALGGRAVKFVSPGWAGVPDRVCLCRGKAVFVELKSEGEKPRAIQRARHAELKRMGFMVYVCDTKASVDDMICKEFT